MAYRTLLATYSSPRAIETSIIVQFNLQLGDKEHSFSVCRSLHGMGLTSAFRATSSGRCYCLNVHKVFVWSEPC